MRWRAAALVLAAAAAAPCALGQFQLPPHPRSELFGQVVISRAAGSGASRPVSFSHATHRIRYTCRVCHLELDFAFKRNATEITEEANRKAGYCGACHDGKKAFGHTEANCTRCHTGTAAVAPDGLLERLGSLPGARFGNGVDWCAAIATGSVTPAASLERGFAPLTLDTTLTLEAEWNFVSSAVFPHAEHVKWLDCANCHPSIFNVKKKTTKHFSMRFILEGRFCGACHLNVAFPLDDCRRCHPAMRNQPR